MQGVTNRGMRAMVGRFGKPDVLFTEFVRVRPGSKTPVAGSDITEAATTVPGIPLVVQLIGIAGPDLVEAAKRLVDMGVTHINLNMGCPFGRMASHLAGGGMFRAPETLPPMLEELRGVVPDSLSVKTRAGIDNPREIFQLVSVFEGAGVDFLVLHPRTVAQKYTGTADHTITRELVETLSIPVIANGDAHNTHTAGQLAEATGAAGLMIGRGAIADPRIFQRIRGKEPAPPVGPARQREIATHLAYLLEQYVEMFCGDAQVLAKMGEILRYVEAPDLSRWLKKLRRAKRVDVFADVLASQ